MWFLGIPLQLQSDSRELSRPVPREKFTESVNNLRPRLAEFVQRHESLNKLMGDVTTHHQTLVKKIEATSHAAEEAGTHVDYSEAILGLKQTLSKVEEEKKRVEVLCVQRESRLNASLDLAELQHDVEMVWGKCVSV